MPTHEDILSVINEFHQRIGMLEAQLDHKDDDMVEVKKWDLDLHIGETMCTNAWGMGGREHKLFRLVSYDRKAGVVVVDLNGKQMFITNLGPTVWFFRKK
jgi:hypothetical protein